MSQHIGTSLARLVRTRAGNVCEYCQLPQSSQEATFHVDHIQPSVGQGVTIAENLALACVTCSLRKAARTEARDPSTKQLVRLFLEPGWDIAVPLEETYLQTWRGVPERGRTVIDSV